MNFKKQEIRFITCADVPSLSSSENLLLPRSLCQPQLQYGATVGDLIQSLGGPEQVMLTSYAGLSTAEKHEDLVVLILMN